MTINEALDEYERTKVRVEFLAKEKAWRDTSEDSPWLAAIKAHHNAIKQLQKARRAHAPQS